MIAEYIAASISILIALAAFGFIVWAFVTMDDPWERPAEQSDDPYYPFDL